MGDWKIYLAGPMSGYPDWNFPAFHHWAEVLRRWNFVVLSPAETAGQVTHLSKEWFMDLDLNYVRVADEVVLLPGWRQSAGAKTELIVAHALGKKCTELIVVTDDRFRLVPIKLDLKRTELLECNPRCALCHLDSVDDDDLCNPCRKDHSR